MAWNSGDLPLYSGVLPPFLYEKGVYNHWIINEALSSQLRFVFDASWTMSSSNLSGQENKSSDTVDQGFSASAYKNRSWEYDGNYNLGALYGSFLYHRANYSNLVKLLRCEGQYILVDTEENILFPSGYHTGQWQGRILRSWRKKKISGCVDVIKSLDRILDCSLGDHVQSKEKLQFPFSLETLLPLVADKNKSIVLAVAGYSYKDMLMSWACRLRRLQITNFIVCALDEETYQFSILQVIYCFIVVCFMNILLICLDFVFFSHLIILSCLNQVFLCPYGKCEARNSGCLCLSNFVKLSFYCRGCPLSGMH